MSTGENDLGLARQMLKQAEAVAQLRRGLEELSIETTETIANLLARIEALEDAPRALAGLTPSPMSWCWKTVGPTGAEALLQELSEWVAWIRHRYPLARRIPDCWTEHPEIIEELTGLWLAWQAAYTVMDAPLTAAAEWHDRWLPGVLHRLEHGPFALGCSTAHTPRPTTVYAAK